LIISILNLSHNNKCKYWRRKKLKQRKKKTRKKLKRIRKMTMTKRKRKKVIIVNRLADNPLIKNRTTSHKGEHLKLNIMLSINMSMKINQKESLRLIYQETLRALNFTLTL